ncbi:armadillo-like helical domain containing protein 1 [Pseudorca crassidens]|uniref:armadillo-like helical domain containing protein 1 n=1 Tax=Pseudorca crassidens TaxID=82174 RepID=UPI00352D354C
MFLLAPLPSPTNELIKDLVNYDVCPALLKGLVALLKPSFKETSKQQSQIVSPHRPPAVVLAAGRGHQGHRDPGARQHEPGRGDAAPARGAQPHGRHGQHGPQQRPAAGQPHARGALGGRVAGGRAARQAQRVGTAVTPPRPPTQYYVQLFPVVEEHVRRSMGEELYKLFRGNAEDLYRRIDSNQADILAANEVNVTKELHLSGLSDSTMSFCFGHCNQGQVAYITHFQREAVGEKEQQSLQGKPGSPGCVAGKPGRRKEPGPSSG